MRLRFDSMHLESFNDCWQFQGTETPHFQFFARAGL